MKRKNPIYNIMLLGFAQLVRVSPPVAVGLAPRGAQCPFFLGVAVFIKLSLRAKIKMGLREKISILNLRTSEIHLFYNLQFFYWHFLEILWLFIFLILYLSALLFSRARRERGGGRVAGRFLKELKYKYKPIKDYKR